MQDLRETLKNRPFTGGSEFTDFKRLVHLMFMQNELTNGCGAYVMSYAGSGDGGFSYGGNQMDLFKNPEARKTLNDILTAATQNDRKIFSENEMKIVMKAALQKDPHALDLFQPRVDLALSSSEGRELINQAYAREVKKTITDVDLVIARIPNPEWREAAMRDAMRLRLVDFHNEFYINNNGKMEQFLRGEQVTLTHEEYVPGVKEAKLVPITVQVEGTLDLSDLERFIHTTKYAYAEAEKSATDPKHINDVERRAENTHAVLAKEHVQLAPDTQALVKMYTTLQVEKCTLVETSQMLDLWPNKELRATTSKQLADTNYKLLELAYAGQNNPELQACLQQKEQTLFPQVPDPSWYAAAKTRIESGEWRREDLTELASKMNADVQKQNWEQSRSVEHSRGLRQRY